MCGIAGIVHTDRDRTCDEAVLVEMRDRLAARGPDDHGHVVLGPVGLAHRRLSVIDLEGGHQPMADEPGDLWIVYNGEIYNFADIREGLISKGHRFRTRSDTEVILAAYREYGPTCVERMNGMFAFALWDARRGELVLARDRLGKKPLYYAASSEGLVFASEIKAILANPGCPAEVDPLAVREYLAFGYVAGPRTMFRNVACVPPGHWGVWRDGQLALHRYWDVAPADGSAIADEAAAIREFDELFHDAVRIRLISDVPLGTFNSGGVDSSLVTAVVAGCKDEPVHSFSVGFEEADFDESEYARLMARTCGTDHHTIVMDRHGFADALDRLVYVHDEPLNHTNAVPIHAVSALAKKHVTVVLTGEGSDELFAGYPRYFIPGIARPVSRVPGLPAAAKFASRMFGDHRLGKIADAAGLDPDDALVFNATDVRPIDVERLTGERWDDRVVENRRRELERARGGTLERLQYLDLKTYLVSILMRQDKMSMAVGLESRIPFLDYRIVEFAFRLSPRLKQNGWSTKKLVKTYARRYLPDRIIDRRKSGFGVPVPTWLGDPTSLLPLVERVRERGIPGLDPRAVREATRVPVVDGRDAELLWRLVNLTIWHETFLNGTSRSPAVGTVPAGSGR